MPKPKTRDELADDVNTRKLLYEKAVEKVSQRLRELNAAVDKLARYDEGKEAKP